MTTAAQAKREPTPDAELQRAAVRATEHAYQILGDHETTIGISWRQTESDIETTLHIFRNDEMATFTGKAKTPGEIDVVVRRFMMRYRASL